MHQAQPSQLAQQQAHIGFGATLLTRQRPDPGWIVLPCQQPGLQTCPQCTVGFAQLHLVIGQMQPGPAAGQGAVFEQFIQQADERRPFQGQGYEAAQAVTVRAELVGLLLMETRQLRQHLLLERLPLGVGEQQLALPRSHHQYILRQMPGFAQAIELPL